jgi:glycosyltransferase involved in cell wall biosynthesis
MTGLELEDLASMQRKTVVLVCMIDSIHVARWIAQFEPTEVKFILFPSGPNRRIHSKILDLIANGKKFGKQISIVPFNGKLSLPLWALDRLLSDRVRGLLLRRTLKKVNPAYVHALELQHAGYVTMQALSDKAVKTPFIATNYGSDIYWFQKFPQHKAKIQRILERADFYSAECQRDYLLAKGLGFDGLELPLAPNAGGLVLEKGTPQDNKASKRKTIAIKGYHGWVGRALVALDAIENLKFELADFEIEVYSADSKVVKRVKSLERRSGLKCTVHRKGTLSQIEVLNILAKSRLYVGVSLSDGISTSLLEAMSVGAFPIQTDTSCANEWISDGATGVLVRELSSQAIAKAIARAVKDDALVDSAQLTNFQVILERANWANLKESSRVFYGL